MSDSTAGLRHQIASAGDLQSVVRTMRALAASNIGHYEKAVSALVDYDASIQLGIGACLRSEIGGADEPARRLLEARAVGAIVFGSDQGLVGPFNDTIADRVIVALQGRAQAPTVWAVGERIAARLADAGIAVTATYPVPISVDAIDMLVGRIQVDVETHPDQGNGANLLLFHNRPLPGALYEPVDRRLLPLDGEWLATMSQIPWPNTVLPEVIGGGARALPALVREYLFVSLYRACAESLASENASRLAAMQRADKSIDELLETLRGRLARLRQGTIDAELFDVIAGYEALQVSRRA